MIKLVALGCLLVLVLIGARRRPERLRLPDGIRLLFVTGSEFLLVGVLLGPLGLDLLDAPTLAALKPLAAIAMGFVGLHFGLQLEARLLRHIPLFYNVAPLIQACGGALLTGLPAWLFLGAFFGPGTETLVGALVIAAAGACSTPAPLDLLSGERRWRGSPLLQMLRHLAEMGELPALALFGVTVCFRHSEPIVPGWESLTMLQWIFATLLLGAAFGVLLEILPQVGKQGTGRLVVGGIGATLFFAGASRYLHLSPLFVSLVAGIVSANIPGQGRRLRRFVDNSQPPFQIFLLLLAGASWRLDSGGVVTPLLLLLAALAVIPLRLAGKGGAGYLLARTTHAVREPHPAFGFGLVAQGAISAALALDYLDGGNTPLAQTVVTVILLSVILTETVAPWILLRLLKADEGAAAERAA